MSEIQKWLETIGLGQYADAFDANEISMDLLAQVDDQMLKDIGVSIGGHRLRIRNAIAKLVSKLTAEPDLGSSSPTTAASAERRHVRASVGLDAVLEIQRVHSIDADQQHVIVLQISGIRGRRQHGRN